MGGVHMTVTVHSAMLAVVLLMAVVMVILKTCPGIST